jgi:transcription antitermination factor NusG
MSLLKVTGVVRVVFYNRHPAIVRQSEIDAVKRFLEEAKEKILCTGDEVEILTGALKTKLGTIVKIKKKYLLLHIEQLAATVCVNTESFVPKGKYR